MLPTQEQIDIVEAVLTEPVIKINAFAGTGKTSTLLSIANTFKSKKILYLAFNKAIEVEAKKRFPSTVTVKTTHALAYGAVKRYAPKINLNKLTNYRVFDIAKVLMIDNKTAAGVQAIFENFCNSASMAITVDDSKDKASFHAQRFFEMMDSGAISSTHSFYLKKYHLLLRNNEIKKSDYDIILLDEAQDVNPVTLDIFHCINAPRRIFVGDKHQQIYSFRGSKNSMGIMKGKELYLTQTFRFPDSIASEANKLLNRFKQEENFIKTSVSEPTVDDEYSSRVYISRTNAGLIEKIADLIMFKKDSECFRTIRNPEEIFSLTSEIHYFLTSQNSLIEKNRFLLSFKSEDELEQYIEDSKDVEIKTAIKLAKKYSHKLDYYKDAAIANFSNPYLKKEDIVELTTAHTSKGLEWDYVELADDFRDFSEILGREGYSNIFEYYKDLKMNLAKSEVTDEFNLFYVAMTRAKRYLDDGSCNAYDFIDMDIDELNMKISEAYESYFGNNRI